jgi:hypothetical protein
MKTLQQFYELMEHTRDVRVKMVKACLAGQQPDAAEVADLRQALGTLESVPVVNGRKQLLVDESKSVSLEMDYEIAELEKDLVFFQQGEPALDEHLAGLHPDFEKHVGAAVDLLGPVRFNNFVTDRDGTISNYCGRYRSSIQSAYNAVYLARYARARTNSATVVTSAPLMNPGIATVSVMPVGTYIYAASKAREFLDKQGQHRTLPVDPERQKLLDAINERVIALTQEPENQKFGLIGSGVQFKFGETTVARQDVSKTVEDAESTAFMQKLEAIVREIDPSGKNTHIKDTGLDVEIVLSTGAEQEFTKADGLYFIDRELGLGLDRGPTLVCGDTPPDLKLVEACMNKCSDVWTIFMTKDDSLTRQVKESAPHSLVLPEVDMLVTALNRVAVKE